MNNINPIYLIETKKDVFLNSIKQLEKKMTSKGMSKLKAKKIIDKRISELLSDKKGI